MTGIISTKKSPLPKSNRTWFHITRTPFHKNEGGEKSVPRWQLYREMAACQMGRTSFMKTEKKFMAFGVRNICENVCAIGIVQYTKYK